MGNREFAETASFGMDTVIMHKVFGERAEEALEAAKKETARIERLLSRFIPDSEISRVNKSAGRRYVELSSDTYEVLSRAIEFSGSCSGCFDITIGPLVDLWRSAKSRLTPPEDIKVKQIIPLVNYKDLILDPVKKAAFLKNKGQSIDLGGIGKGYAAERILEVLREYGITSAFTNFGGNVAAIGAKPEGSPWRVGIQHPRSENKLIGALSISNKSVVTSGDYQRFFVDKAGNIYHHILNPATGYPSESGLISATVITKNSMAADALSTILFIAGLERDVQLLKSFHYAEAILIDKDLQVHITKGLKGDFQPAEGINMNILD